ncbi:MAG TPA: kelch repeat-containing protein, partial [Verrucomicrobiota bacterium]|nr:kelch repeat-containing protein [Verrucomicrobiota bacterium]
MNTSKLLSRALVGLVGSAVTMASLFAVDPDLPYNSGSSGGSPLTFKEIVNPGRRGHSMVYDTARQRLVVFGGYSDVGNTYLNDTWLFNGSNWVMAATTVAPSIRSAFHMVYDPVRQKVLLFGGYNPQVGRLNDTWTWDGTNWAQLNPATVPDARYGAAIAFDNTAGRQQAVMFGGNGGADQTWVWDGTNWNLRTPGARPPGDEGAACAYDAARQRVVLFHQNRQTWVWDGNNWANVTPAETPPGRSYGSMTYDPGRQEVVLFGGSDKNDTWIWNGQVWTQRTPTTSPQIRRDGNGFAYHPGLQRAVLHGGYIVGVDGNNSDTWFWNGTDWTWFSGKVQEFDMTSRPDGIFNFTTGDVPPGVTMTFKKNAANTPVRLLFTGDFTVRGAISVDGGYGAANLPEGVVARGGPGGFDGGRGGIPFNRSSSFAGVAGQGPGGGGAGVTRRQDGSDGLHNNDGGYGNNFLQPLTGGSGGGGGGS